MHCSYVFLLHVPAPRNAMMPPPHAEPPHSRCNTSIRAGITIANTVRVRAFILFAMMDLQVESG